MKKIICSLTIIAVTCLLLSCGGNNEESASLTVGKYKKEPLPVDVSYRVSKDLSDSNIDKNEMYVELNKKISVGQIATVAEKLFNSKEKRRRFYIFYSIAGVSNGAYWATSHFDPDLQIEILTTTAEQEQKLKKADSQIDGTVKRHWYEEKYTSASYTLYEKGKKLFMRITFKDGTFIDDEMVQKKVKDGYRLSERDGNGHGEYYMYNNDGNLDFYNDENKKFTTGIRVK